MVFQDDAKFATRIVRSILTEVLPYMNIYMTEELSDKEIEELENLDITIKSSNMSDEEAEEGEDTDKDNDEDIVDANGGDITSSTSPTAEEMQSDDVLTAPLTGTVLNTQTGAPVVEDTEDGPQ